MKLISLIISILLLYVLYKIFDTYGKNAGIAAKVIYEVLAYFVTNNANGNFTLGGLLVTAVLALIVGFISWKVFEKTNSFLAFFLWLLLVEILFVLLASVIIGLLFVGAVGAIL